MFRGFQIGTHGQDIGTMIESTRQVGLLGLDTIRYQMVCNDPRYMGKLDRVLDFRRWPFDQYEIWYKDQVNYIRQIAQHSADFRNPVRIIVDCHSPYGGALNFGTRKNKDFRHLITEDDDYRRRWEKLWIWTVGFLDKYDLIAGYDLCNEPACTVRRWADVSSSLAKKLRHITDKPIIIGTPSGHVKHLGKLISKFNRRADLDNIIFQPHFYHSGNLNERVIRRELREVRKASRRGHCIYVGEVGSDLSKNTPEYVAEFFQITLGLLERWGVGWTAHAYNESHIFNYEGTPAMDVITSFRSLP